MVTTATRPKVTAPTGPAAVSKPKRKVSQRLLAGALVVGIAVGAGGYVALSDDGPSLSPTEVAELRSTEMATSLEKQWLADPMNAARARALDQASILEAQWLADPVNVARARAELYAEIEYQKWLASQD